MLYLSMVNHSWCGGFASDGRLPCRELPAGIELVLNSRVMSVRDGYVTVANKNKEEYEIPFGACVWATGIAMHPLVQELQAAFPQEQNHFRCRNSRRASDCSTCSCCFPEQRCVCGLLPAHRGLKLLLYSIHNPCLPRAVNVAAQKVCSCFLPAE
jgi:hypothetical protein